ncbi:MOSC domain-containing protein [Jiangella gansuensis]|uniref:MOSC domain-containing protein n=1 Tax=Jiangella gansuensis TaxID=281473 RepID=UPI0004B07A55|nr:MOSC domain-containing protein [Jiangella gansuensis]
MPAPQAVTGPSWRVARLGRTPVKGMAHPALPTLDLTPSGPLHDRVFCLADADGEVVRTVRDDVLMACRALWKPPVLMIRTPIGDATGVAAGGVPLAGSYWGRPVELVALDGPWSPLLSRYLGRPVSLCRVSAPGAVVWSGSVSVVTTSSLAEVARRIGRPPDDGARFRPTVVVDTGIAGPFVEDGWAGRRLRIGSAVIRVAGRMARCAVVDRRPGAGGRDADVLAALAPDRVHDGEIVLGVHGDVEVPGRVAVGDAVVLGDRQGGVTR